MGPQDATGEWEEIVWGEIGRHPVGVSLGAAKGMRLDPAKVWALTDGRCGICGTAIDHEWLTDHIVPLDLGGEHTYDNTQPAHPDCVTQKDGRFLATCLMSLEPLARP